jgi:hypothetical protein
MAAYIATEWIAFMMPNLSNDVEFNQVFLTDLGSKEGGVGESQPSHLGGHTVESLSDAACFMLNHKIKQRYRGGKPRTYIPGVSIDQCTDGKTLTSAAINAINTGFTDFNNALKTGAGDMQIAGLCAVSYYAGFTVVTNQITGRAKNVPNIKDVADVYPIQASNCNNILGSQRRRLRPR